MDTRFKTSDIDEIGPIDGLIAYYNMDNLDGTTLLDNSGNGNNATNVGATLVAGKVGNALSFNGTSYVTALPINSVNLTVYTLSGWFYRTDTVGHYGTILGSINGATSWEFESLPSGGGSTRLFFYNSSILTTTYSLNQWNFFTFVKGATTASLYLNGNFIASVLSTSIPNINSLQIGRWNFSQNFNGLIDEVRIYNKALTSAEISQLYKLNSKFTQLFTDNYESSLNYSQTISLTTNISGNNLKNDVTGENIGIISGATLNNDYFNFDGVDDYINIGDNARLNTGGTISCWYYARSSGERSYGRLIDKSIDTSSTNGYMIYLNNSLSIRVGINGNDPIIDSSSFPSLNVWHHIAVVMTSTKKEMWIDGIKVANNTNTTLPPDIAGNVYIGNRADATDRTFDGYIKNVRIYTRSLDAEEIKYLYNKGK